MTTVVDPNGTPTPVYNRSGTTVDALTADVFATPAPIVRYAKTTVVLVTIPNGSARMVSLPADAEVGDVVEVYCLPNANGDLTVFPASGDSIFGDTGAQPTVFRSAGKRFRKTDSTDWSML